MITVELPRPCTDHSVDVNTNLTVPAFIFEEPVMYPEHQ
jgi:hypothetical protein